MIKAILQFAIERRYLVMFATGLLILAGVLSYQKLPIDAVPDITNVQVQINTQAAGYSPLEAEQRITYIVETALAGLPDLAYTRSISRYGLSQVTAVFEDGTDLYFARNLISQKLVDIKNDLPGDISPQMGPIATGLGEIYSYAVVADENAKQANGEYYDAIALREIQDWIIKPQLALVKGVTEINTIGGYEKAFHITPDTTQMLQYGISFSQIAQAVELNNQNVGAGFIETNGQQLLVRSPAQLADIQQIEQLIVGLSDNSPVRLNQIANVSIGKELRTGAATFNGAETVIGTAMMLVGENSREIALNVAAKLEQIQTSLPAGVNIVALYDRTSLVDKAIATVQKNLVEGALLVIVILFLLLGNFRAALITAAVIPLAMLATITGMVKAGISANLMSLGALDFGLIVDGAVIIVENAILKLSQAHHPLTLKQRLTLVFNATNQVIRPSLFGVCIITLVYIPLFSLTGVEGKMFHPMAATVVIALLSAMVLAFTFVPAAIALFIRGKVSEKQSPVIRVAKSAYRPCLAVALKFNYLVLIAATGLVAASIWLASHLGSEFIPQLNEGDIALHAMRIPGTGVEQAVKMQDQLEKTLLDQAEVDKVFSKIGTAEVATDPMPPNVADTFVILKPREQWPNPNLTQAELVAKLETKVEAVPGNNYEFTQPIQMRFNELISGVRADFAVKVFGDDLTQLLTTANAISATLQQTTGAADVKVEQVDGLPMLTITPKRTQLARFGLTANTVQQTVNTAIGGQMAGYLFEGDRRFEIIVRLPETQRVNIQALADLPIIINQDEYVPLSEVADIDYVSQPNQISRENGKRRVVVTANVRGSDLGSFVLAAQNNIDNQVQIPAGYWLDYGGTFEQLESASKTLTLVVPATLIVIFALLIMAFNSFKDALIIFTGIPLALTGGVFALWLRDMPLSISAAVGFIALSGIAVLNGLVMLAFIRERFIASNNLLGSITEGAISRLRPVLMTALVASLGFVPMALNIGTGAEVQRPLATVVIGGIISSTLLTLFVLPGLYKIFYKSTRLKPLPNQPK
ncbi:CusA/CzcA family heavy metal efflux RND transporter [Catenovulum sp. 2E275]|uniref:efflux RND transporter permease subunit n=1 Tax=Catenovulum sp. 2E275 TaxID=2980497 RepID=UPI0021D10F1F|nr:CusA/CzcA family heavy metal efflux RND transporter [Catenovulum sp. 2E275]MCU4676513.1 CusA/CzcA family heavy metal efflux RND transporter [Catenovulum sp. 2E275]